jgi:hypothetical protein
LAEGLIRLIHIYSIPKVSRVLVLSF